MCPLLTSPNIGYPDWQRIADWDGGVVYSQSNTVVSGTIQSAVIPVGRFGYIGGEAWAAPGTGLIQFLWYADAAATILVGTRRLILYAGIDNPAQLRVPNMGPYLVVELHTVTGGSWTANVDLLLTNRYHPCELIPYNAFALDGSAVIPNGGTAVYTPTDYFEGPARIAGNFDTVNPQIAVIAVDTANNRVIHDTSPVFTTTPFVYDTLLPFGYWALSVFNFASVPGTLNLVVTPTLTGST